MGAKAVNQSKEALLDMAARNLQSTANFTTEKLEMEMEKRIDDVLTVAQLPITENAYLEFSTTHTGFIHNPSDEPTSDVEPDPDDVIAAPIYRGIYFIDDAGIITVAIGNKASCWGTPRRLSDGRDVTGFTDQSMVFDYTLKQCFDEIAGSPDTYRGKVYVAGIKVTAADNEARNSNLIAEPLSPPDETGRFQNGIIRCATPVYKNGRFKGVAVVDINWLHLMRTVNDFQYGRYGYAYLQEITGEVRDQVQASGSTNISNVLPDGTVIAYGVTMHDIHVGLTIAHPDHQFVGWMDPTSLGIPTLTYLGSEQQSYKTGIGRYVFAGVDKWTAYAPVISDSRTVNQNDWTIGATSPIGEFTEPAIATEEYIAEEMATTVELIKDRTDNLQTQNVIFIFTFIIAIIVLTISVIFAKNITVPVKNLADVADRISRGGLEATEIKVDSNDEIGYLAESFERMVASVRYMESEIDSMDAELERYRAAVSEKMKR